MKNGLKTSAVKRIHLANPRGFCAGVDREIDIGNKALERDWADVYVKDEATNEWKFDSSELTDYEGSVETDPDPRMDAVFEMIFGQLDWYD